MEKNSKKSWWIGFIGTIVILGAFAIAALVLANVGIRVYQNVVIANNENFELRTSLNYVATEVRQKDNLCALRIEEIDGIPMLIMPYNSSNGNRNETLIYHYDGYLREYIRLAGMDFDPELGMEMIEISDFKMELTGKILTLTAKNKKGETDSLKLSVRTEDFE